MIELKARGAEKQFYYFIHNHMQKKISQLLKKEEFSLEKIMYKINPEMILILKWILNNIDMFILSKPSDQKKLIMHFQYKYPCSINNGTYLKKEDRPPIYALLYYLFINRGYNEFSKEIKIKLDGKTYTYSAYDLIRDIDCKTCPYCNRNYISAITRNKASFDSSSKKTRTELDHFFPTSIFPFLAINFYNLIPSCKTCNHLKSNQNSYDDNLLSPYDIKNNDFEFDYSVKKIFAPLEVGKIFSRDSLESVAVIFDKKNTINEEYFLLEDLYQEHTDIVLELIVKRMFYPQSYIDHLKKNFKFSNDEIYRFLLNNYQEEKDFHKRPLSKLTNDISKDLGFF